MNKVLPIKYPKRRKYKDVFCGFHISDPVMNFIRLYSVANQLTLSTLIRSVIVKWINDNELNEDKLITDIVYSIQKEWNKNKIQSYPYSFSAFVENTKKELERKKLEKEQINNILKRLIK